MGAPETATGRIESEEALIQEYLAPLAANTPGAHGLSDDCATLAAREGEELVLTTDAVAAGVHFFPDDAPEDVAWKALGVNVSDLAAKGATPVAYLMSLAFPEPPERAWLARFAQGLGDAQARWGLALIGGDTDRRPGPLAITITAVGTVRAGAMVRRSTARAGDRLFISGTLGCSALGLKLRQSPGLAAEWSLEAGDAEKLVARYLRPEPRLGWRAALLANASAAMDISDGLAKDLARLCKASGVRGIVRGRDVPLSTPVMRAVAAEPACFVDAITGGDDYEILASVPAANAESFVAAARQSGVMATEIGHLEEGSGIAVLDACGKTFHLDRTGWEHF